MMAARTPDDVLKHKTQAALDISLENNVKTILLEKVGFKNILTTVKAEINELQNLDLKKPLNEELDKLPLKMWDEILRELVEGIALKSLSHKPVHRTIAENAKKALDLIT